jgi:hypothetical protein
MHCRLASLAFLAQHTTEELADLRISIKDLRRKQNALDFIGADAVLHAASASVDLEVRIFMFEGSE